MKYVRLFFLFLTDEGPMFETLDMIWYVFALSVLDFLFFLTLSVFQTSIYILYYR